MENNDYDEVNNWRKLVREQLEKRPIIDDAFFEEYFGKVAQAKFMSNECDELHDAMLMNGLSGIDCRKVDFSKLSLENYTKITFDSSTQFPEDVREVFEKILEKGKEYGHGLEELTQEGKLSGAGIHVAVIDQDFDDETLKDVDVVTHKQDNPPGDHYHGKTVTSIIASKSCGIAKGAKVHFFGEDSRKYKGSKERAFQEIIEYNSNCKDEKDKILVLSGSWRLKDESFEKWSQALRDSGCELVCQNNFARNFSEVSGNDPILEFSDEEKEIIPDKMKKRLEKMDLKRMIKIPINRIYNQFETPDSAGERDDENFKYQASFSNSWGIPQVAGLLALYRKKDRTLTFDDFCSICRETADEKGVIDTKGIYEAVAKRISIQKGTTFEGGDLSQERE